MPHGAFPDPFRKSPSPARIVAVIPARYGSSRLAGKPLADIAGQPMIEHVYRRAAAAPGVDAVVVATDDERIVAAVERFGGVARMTDAAHATGTDRIAELARGLTCSVVVNVQGDLPLIEPGMIAEVIAPLTADVDLPMSTLRQPLDDPADYDNPNVVKVVTTLAGDALYFSRAVIPYARHGRLAGAGHDDRPGPADGGHDDWPGPADGGHSASPDAVSGFGPSVVSGFSRTFKHIGLYAYRRDFLVTFAALTRTPLEQSESLEQLRALEHGFRIRAVETRYRSIEVDTADDLERVRRLLRVATRA